MENRQYKKISRKTKRCEHMLFKHENISVSKCPTRNLLIGNGGIGCSIDKEYLMEVFCNYGFIEKVVTPIAKPYAFVVFQKLENATQAFSAINGIKLPTKNTFYLSYINDEDLPKEEVKNPSWPRGLILLEDFVTEEEEKQLLSIVNFEDDMSGQLKHRKVQHYGYEFLYGFNNINKERPMQKKIPELCISYLERLVELSYLPRVPEQLTVNHYLPGQGIPPHVDTHSAFEDKIVSLSLSSKIVMEFSKKEETVSVLLPQRSVLIMSGESRYLWKHGITPRKTDVVQCGTHLSLVHRAPRTSFTFRLIRKDACDCDYKEQCDSHAKEVT